MYEWLRAIPGTELLKAEEDPSGDFQRVTLRVKDEKTWERKLVRVLRAADAEDAAWAVAINKSYFLNEAKKPTFAWVLLVFGDFDGAEEALRQLLTVEVAKPAPESAVLLRAQATPGAQRFLQRAVRNGADGRKVEVTAPLPHINHPRGATFTRDSKTGLNGTRGAAVDGLSGEPRSDGIAPNGAFDE